MSKMHNAIEYPTNRDELALQFKSEVSDRAADVDPDDQLDWKALTMGWALAKGLSPEDAYAFALFIRYQTNLG